MNRYTPIDWIAWGVTTVGALNWGFHGVGGFNLVHSLFGRNPAIERLIYGLVGFAGLWSLVRFTEYVSAPRPMERIGLGGMTR